MQDFLFLIPLLPFVGFLVNGLLGRRLPTLWVSIIACLAPAASFACACGAFWQIVGADESNVRLAQSMWTWISAGDLSVEFAFALDRLSVLMTLFVTGVGTLIHIYSTGYMRGDPGYAKFFAYLNLFMSAMLVLVLADNLVLLFLGWEGVGLCSYLLIGFWYRETANCQAGIKAFVVNRIGDLAFLLGIFGVFWTVGSFGFGEINAWAGQADGGLSEGGQTIAFWIALAFFIGATGKSAQIPLYVWLPDAMAGPTPVSALIHAATMVTSGLYVLARLGPLFNAAPEVLAIVATIGALTALLAALIAFSQNDIKKVLAYSTVSQLGYMFLAAGVGAYTVAIFHVVTHAFFKALLFLGAGAVIHSMHHEQDMRKMGGLRKKIPQTFGVFLVGALALAGFPLLAGFWSKDAILHVTHVRAGLEGASAGWNLLWIIGLVTAFLTACYTFRQIIMVFFGEYRGADEKSHTSHGHGLAWEDVHESPLVMRAPLFILAALAIIGGYFGVPHFLEVLGIDNPLVHSDEGVLGGLVLGAVIACAGIGTAFLVFFKGRDTLDTVTQKNPVGSYVYRLSKNKFWVDELYQRLIVKPLWLLAEVLFFLVDRAIIDLFLVHGWSLYMRSIGNLLRRLQTGRLPTYAFWFLLGVIGVLAGALWWPA